MPEQQTESAAATLCVVCGSALLVAGEMPPTAAHVRRGFHRCDHCGSIDLADTRDRTLNARPGDRLGSAQAHGRDYAMAMMAVTILGAPSVDLLWWQPGVSADRPRIAGIPGIDSITDLEITDKGHMEAPSKRSADILIGNEVLQGLAKPDESLAAALKALRSDGLAIFSTDVATGTDPTKFGFLRVDHHRVMWGATGLSYVAQREGFVADFRLPQISLDRSLARKRYVLMSKSDSVRTRIRRYFGHVAFAPSEPAS